MLEPTNKEGNKVGRSDGSENKLPLVLEIVLEIEVLTIVHGSQQQLSIPPAMPRALLRMMLLLHELRLGHQSQIHI